MQKQFFTLLFILFIISNFAQPIAAQEVSQSYEVLMQSGIEKYDAGDFISAKTYFEMALQKKKDDATAQKKLNETVEKIKQQMQKQEGFYLKLDEGDRLLALNKLEEAKTAYQEALKVFPDDKYTLAQLAEINKTLTEEQNKLDNYNKALNLGSELVEQANYEAAILQFEEAIALYPNQEIPKEKLAEAKQLLEKRKLTQTKAAGLVAEAENFILRKDYQAAIEKLEEAQTLTPDDVSIAQLLTETRAIAEKSEAYNTILAKADEHYANKNFEKAREQYQAALAAWPGQAYAEDMILRINQTLESESYLAQEQYNNAITESANFEA
jgi:tetratricopeptide (TPR) repeat protein